ncbi:MAG: hypothetical protein EXR79_03785 [Myxococcales bacterium]|nr:hypothetical protein [Myxococcales bacterium]
MPASAVAAPPDFEGEEDALLDGPAAAPAATLAPDGQPEAPERSLGLRRAAASTDDLYDLTPLALRSAAYAELAAAAAGRQWKRVMAHAAVVASSADAQHDRALRDAAVLHDALARTAIGDRDGAVRAWQRLAQSGPLAQRARLALAEAALRRKDLDEALSQYAAVAPWHPQRDQANLQMARLELQRGEIGRARDALERVRPELLTRSDRALQAVLAGEAAERSGRPAEAAQHWRVAWNLDEMPHAADAQRRLERLDAAPTPADHIERILRRREVSAHQVRGWLREADAVADEASGLRDYVHGALAMRDKKTRAAGLALLACAQERLEDPLLRARALFAWGDALGKTGDDRGAIDALERLDAADIPADLRARALQRLHRLYMNVAAAADAERALVQLLDHHPDADARELAVWSLGWQRFQQGDWASALKHFVQLERDFGHLWTGAQQPWRAKAIYWQGRSLLALGQVDPANEAWATVANTWPQTYYGVLAVDRVRELDRDRADRLQGPPPSPSDAVTIQVPDVAQLRVQRSDALDEAALLVRAGLLAEARTLLRGQLARGLPRDGIHLLATLYELQGAPRAAYAVVERHTRRAARPDDATAQVWRQSFPKAYFEAVVPAADGAGLPRSLLYAIARHESGFLATAQSKAGACGLVQLLPDVARNVATVHDRPLPSTRQLFQPERNLDLGALYLAQLASLFRGNHLLVAAAYNAGPYAVQGWVKKAARQPLDVFVENIPYPATRAYVMQVTATAQTYAFLYPEWSEGERDRLSRGTAVPESLGPFMKPPCAQRAALAN